MQQSPRSTSHWHMFEKHLRTCLHMLRTHQCRDFFVCIFLDATVGYLLSIFFSSFFDKKKKMSSIKSVILK